MFKSIFELVPFALNFVAIVVLAMLCILAVFVIANVLFHLYDRVDMFLAEYFRDHRGTDVSKCKRAWDASSWKY